LSNLHGSRRRATPEVQPEFRSASASEIPRPQQLEEAPRWQPGATAARPPHKAKSAFESRAFPVFLGGIIVALVTGFAFRTQLGLEAEEGLGYWLGIGGVGCVVVLLVYPVRKRIPGLRWIGTVPAWFHFHMSLGLLAPTLILFHAGFRAGSVNAAIALISMLIVAGSGLLGRMLYVRIHRNLTGKRAEVRAMMQDAVLLKQTQVPEFAEVAELKEKLEATLHAPQPHVFSALAYALATSARITVAQRRMLSALKRGSRRVATSGQPGARASARRLQRDGTVLVKAYCQQLRQAGYLTFFERLFALWHIIHMPLFLLMVVAVVIHIVAVHLY